MYQNISVCFCVLSFVIQHAKRMRHIVVCDLSGCTIFFSTLSHTRHDFRRKKKITENKMRVLIVSTNFV